MLQPPRPPRRHATIRTVSIFVVASSSPRRHRLLRGRGYEFSVTVPDVDETPFQGEPGRVMVMRLAFAKAVAAAPVAPPGSVVLGVDTTVDLDGVAIGKPESPDDAIRLLGLLSARTHTVHSGYAIVASDVSRASIGWASSDVAFRRLGESEIADYVATGEPLDRAGAYAIGEGGSAFIANLDGSISNVMGLPMESVEPLLAAWGIEPAYR